MEFLTDQKDRLKLFWELFKINFFKRGGFKSKANIFGILLSLWGLYTLAREKGLLMKKSIVGKHVFLTGAGSGLGRRMAIKLAQLKANVSISDINEEGLIETQKLIK